MKLDILDIIACPTCKGFPLNLKILSEAEGDIECINLKNIKLCEYYCGYLQKNIAEDREYIYKNCCTKCNCRSVDEGILHCMECDSYYLIKNGIPKLITDNLKCAEEVELLESYGCELKNKIDNFASITKKCEIKARGEVDTGDIINNLTSSSHQYMENFQFNKVSKYLDLKREDILLDSGCGYGIFSIPFSKKCRYVIATDITFETLTTFKNHIYKLSTEYFEGFNFFPEDKIILIQADSCQLPFRKGFKFDKAISIAVLWHIPTVEERLSALNETYRYLNDGGLFIASVGHDNLIHKMIRFIKKLPRERIIKDNYGSGGPGYFYLFKYNEFKEFIAQYFVIDKMDWCQTHSYIFLKFNKQIASFIEKILLLFPYSHVFCKTLIIKCHKKQQ